ncbi:MAG: molybdenum ABC transporter ATP-binding protein [Alphaproteobacteria bacterium]
MALDVAVRKRLGGFRLDVAFAGERPGVTALFGASGSGKTATVRMIAGMSRPDRGRIRVDGRTFFDRAAGIDLPPERRRVGYVFQDAKLFPHMSVKRNLDYGLRRAPPGERRIAFDEVVGLLGIESLLERRPHALSGGERQRVALGRALLAQPRLVLLDEPLAALDAARKAEILPFVERLRDALGLPMLYVSHSLDEVVRLADDLVVLDGGRVRAAGPLVATMSRPELRHVVGAVDFGAVLEAAVVVHDDRYALTVLETPGGHLRVPRLEAPPGRRVRVRIRAVDAALALEPPVRSSVVNVLFGTIKDVTLQEGPGATVRVDLAGADVLAATTRLSVDRLGLAPGVHVYVMIKAVALDREERARSRRDAGAAVGSASPAVSRVGRP